MSWLPVLIREADRGGKPVLRLGHAQLDRYLEFVAARARPNTVLATGYDLKVFFSAADITQQSENETNGAHQRPDRFGPTSVHRHLTSPRLDPPQRTR